jgi:hypothetical protein
MVKAHTLLSSEKKSAFSADEEGERSGVSMAE